MSVLKYKVPIKYSSTKVQVSLRTSNTVPVVYDWLVHGPFYTDNNTYEV